MIYTTSNNKWVMGNNTPWTAINKNMLKIKILINKIMIIMLIITIIITLHNNNKTNNKL